MAAPSSHEGRNGMGGSLAPSGLRFFLSPSPPGGGGGVGVVRECEKKDEGEGRRGRQERRGASEEAVEA